MYQIQSDNLIMANGNTPGECISQLTNTDKSPQVVIERDGNSDKVYLRCTYLVNKNIFLGEYSTGYGHDHILDDVALRVCNKMGYRLIRSNSI